MNIANKITIFRIILVPFFLGCLLYWSDAYPIFGTVAAILFSVACFTDALDGYTARRMHQKTRLGALIDPLADKTLLVTAFFGLAFMSHLPPEVRIPLWLALLVISRDLLILIGVGLIYALQQHFEPRTNFLGKATTFSQMVFILALLWRIDSHFIVFIILITSVLTLLSGVSYLRIGAKILTTTGSKKEA